MPKSIRAAFAGSLAFVVANIVSNILFFQLGHAVLFDPEMEPGLRSTSTSTGTTAGTAGTVRAVTGSTQGGVSLGANDLESTEDTTTSSAGETEQGLAEVDNTGLKESSSTRKFLALVGVAVMCRFQ